MPAHGPYPGRSSPDYMRGRRTWMLLWLSWRSYILSITHTQYSYPGSLLPAQVFLLELFAQMQDLLIGTDQLHRVPLQLIKRRKGFPFRQTGIDGFNHLIIIHAYSPILALQVGQFHVIVHRSFIDPNHFERTIENGREDELRFGLGTR